MKKQTIHYLMIKKCINTGMMYLCKTSSPIKDPYTYSGSGIKWLKWINTHDSYVITCIIGQYKTKEELRKAGLFYSKKYDVINHPAWANLTQEQGNGGLIGTGQLGKHWEISRSGRQNISIGHKKYWNRDKLIGNKMRKQIGQKLSRDKNYQFKGWIVTPWGKFASVKEAITEAKKIRKTLPHQVVISDNTTLRKYINNLTISLNKEGRRTPKAWRGKTPKQIGFDIRKTK